ncbi:MAG TPA: ABC transporter substrate-binding protein [Dongiaceae bacterium]|jgi:NitT/TauT family transport system substrate-binding protein|nr:ABC transporter substrate-binding protein [Dongiaceae bacterium]
MKMRFVFGFLASLGALGMLDCAAAADDVVHVGGVVNDPNVILPVQAAAKLGLFDKLGVKVEFNGYSGGSTAMEALAAGAADVAVFIPAGMSMAVARGVKAKMVAVGILGYPGWDLFVKKDSSAQTVADLANKKIGITSNGSNTDFLALWAADQAKISIVRIPVGGGGLAPNLLSGNIDGVVAYPPVSYSLKDSGNARSVVDFGTSMTNVIQSTWVASEKAISENPEGLRKMLSGAFSAVDYMKKNPEWAYQFIAEQMKVDAKVAKEEYESTILPFTDDGVIDEAALERSLNFLTLAGMSNMPAAKDLYTSEFVPAKKIEP